MKYSAIALLIVAISFTIGCQQGHSESDFPKGCAEQGITYKESDIVLNIGSESKQSLYLFHNISDKSFWLNHPIGKDPGASAGWASEIGAENWSALTISSGTDNFALNCSLIGDGGVKYINCMDVLKSCKVENAEFASENTGSYWVAENMPLQKLLDAIKNRGVSW